MSHSVVGHVHFGPYRTGIKEPRVIESPEDLDANELNRIIRNGRRRGKSNRGRPKNTVYRYQGADVLSVWTKGEPRPHLARHLRSELRIVIGFWQCPGIPTKYKAAISGCRDSGEYLELNRKLLQDYEFTRIDAIRHCIVHGLPASAAVHLPEHLVCPSCQHKTFLLPCLRCWRGLDDDPSTSESSELEDIEQLTDIKFVEPTKARPGSREKIRVLSERLQKRQPLWHPDDPVDEWQLASDFWPGDA